MGLWEICTFWVDGSLIFFFLRTKVLKRYFKGVVQTKKWRKQNIFLKHEIYILMKIIRIYSYAYYFDLGK